MNSKVDDNFKHIGTSHAKASSKKNIKVVPPISSDQNSVRYFLDLVNRFISVQELIARDLQENHKLREQFRAYMQRGHW